MFALRILFGDVDGVSDDQMIAPKLGQLYESHWAGIVNEGIASGISAETAALVLAVTFYQDTIKNQATTEDVETIRRCILDKDHDDNHRPAIMFRMELSMAVANGWAGKKIGRDHFALALRDLHRAIFDGNDDHLDDTATYLIEGGDRLAKYLNIKTESRSQGHS